MEIAQAPKKPQPETDKSFICILDKFPLKNLEDLYAMERKLKQDVTFESELVRYFFYPALHFLTEKCISL